MSDQHTFRFTFGDNALSFTVTVRALSQVDAAQKALDSTLAGLGRLGENLTGLPSMKMTWVKVTDEDAAAHVPALLVE